MLSPALSQDVLHLLASGESFAIAMIVDHQGSAPRHTGSRLLIRRNGQTRHSLGGGALEVQAIRLAQQVLETGVPLTQTFVLNAERGDVGMLCGGQAKVLVHPLDPANREWLNLYRALADRLVTRQPGWLITRLTPEIGQWLAGEDGLIAGVARLKAEAWTPLLNSANRRRPVCLTQGQARFLIEPVIHPGKVYIFGAGHIGQQLASLARLADFEVAVLDDRPEFANRDCLPLIEQVTVLPSYTEALAGLAIDENSLLVIVTHAHVGDLTVLRQALRSQAGYIGMIGSRRKRDSLYARLLEEGFTAADLQRVHCPIGLAISAETPVEIAISIMAEIIQIRAARRSCR